ncbi:MAG: hypothetical protein AMJ76_03600 [Dehalococcoidia bacterium SM23_28_1]|nr:MAG: hypothetical protein AMJ76_03600 [Dehalococcoidia bacterium SM23_28_1]
MVALIAAVAALTIALGAWQGWLAQAAGTTYVINDVIPPEDECGTPDYTTTDLNSVIAAVSDEDTLVLCEGSYDAGVVVDKKITIEGQADVDIDKIVIDGTGGGDDGMEVTADDVTIRHLTLVGPICGNRGIDILPAADNTTITDVDASDWSDGIFVSGTDTLIQQSNIHDNLAGIFLAVSTGTHILSNDIVDNTDNGIDMDAPDLALVGDNTISGNDRQVNIAGSAHIQFLRNTIVTDSNGIVMDLPAEALVIIGGSDANANTFDGPLTAAEHYIVLACGSEATVNATHNYWKGSPAISRGVAGVIFNDEDDPDADCPGDDAGAVVFHPVAPGPAPAPSPSPTPTPTPSFVWTGEDATPAATALDCIAGNFAIAYQYDATAGWSRYVPDNAALSNLSTVDQYDSLLVLVTASGVVCQDMPVAVPAP